MADAVSLHRLCTLAEHRRWLVGVATGVSYRWITAAAVAVQGGGLAAHVEVVAHRRARLPREMRRTFRSLQRRTRQSAGTAPLLAARLAECQAALLDELAAEVAPIWDRLSAVSTHGPALWTRQTGLLGCTELSDGARLAELSGQNIIDGFAQRDLAQDGRGRPLLPLPTWMLLRDGRKPRMLLDVCRTARLMYLPAARDDAAAGRIQRLGAVSLEDFGPCIERLRAAADACAPPPEEWIAAGALGSHFSAELAARLAPARVLEIGHLGIEPLAFKAAAVALLGLLHLDQVPANLPSITGARTPRVLGRITPGSVVAWHRLLRELAARRPNTVTLRSAI